MRLSDGEVRHGEPAWDFDVQAYLGRYLVLTAASPVCRFGDAVGTGTESFASLDAIPGDPSLCSWGSGPNLTCGLNTSSFTPECLGDGLLVRDASERLYRLRVIEDRSDAEGTFLDIEWVALP